MSRNMLLQVRILCVITLANFVAQVFYFLHLYYTPQQMFPDPKSTLALGAVLALFLLGYSLYVRQHRAGIYLLAGFLSLEFLFYLWNTVGAALNGFGWFFQLNNPDPVLRIVFAIGYVNLFASGYFLWLLFAHRRQSTKMV